MPAYSLCFRSGRRLLVAALLLTAGCGGGGGGTDSGGPTGEEPPSDESASLTVDSLTLSGPLEVVSTFDVRVLVNDQPATLADGEWSATLTADPATGELPTTADIVLFADEEAIRQFSIELRQEPVE